MMTVKVSQRLANANQLKIKDKILYYNDRRCELTATDQNARNTDDCLDMEEEHSNRAMSRSIETEEVDQCIL